MSKIINIERHPILKEAVEVCHAIEKCGASDELTQVVIKASTLCNSIDDLLDQLDSKGGRVGAVVMPNKVLAGDKNIREILGVDTVKYGLWCDIVNDVYMEYDDTSDASKAEELMSKIELLLDLVSQREA